MIVSKDATFHLQVELVNLLGLVLGKLLDDSLVSGSTHQKSDPRFVQQAHRLTISSLKRFLVLWHNLIPFDAVGVKPYSDGDEIRCADLRVGANLAVLKAETGFVWSRDESEFGPVRDVGREVPKHEKIALGWTAYF